MTKNWKRWLAAGLCAAMVGGMLPTSSAMAEEVEAQPLLPVEEQQETPEVSLLPEGEKKDHDEPIENNEPTAETLSEEEELLAEEKEPLEEEEEDLLPEELPEEESQPPVAVFAVRADIPDNMEKVNLAKGKDGAVTFSDVEGGKNGTEWKYPQFVGSNVADGDPSTRWSAGKTNEQWVTVDLGQAYNIDQVIIRFHAKVPKYKVLVSVTGNDGDWTEIKNVDETMDKSGSGGKRGYHAEHSRQRSVCKISAASDVASYQWAKLWLQHYRTGGLLPG